MILQISVSKVQWANYVQHGWSRQQITLLLMRSCLPSAEPLPVRYNLQWCTGPGLNSGKEHNIYDIMHKLIWDEEGVYQRLKHWCAFVFARCLQHPCWAVATGAAEACRLALRRVDPTTSGRHTEGFLPHPISGKTDKSCECHVSNYFTESFRSKQICRGGRPTRYLGMNDHFLSFLVSWSSHWEWIISIALICVSSFHMAYLPYLSKVPTPHRSGISSWPLTSLQHSWCFVLFALADKCAA